MLRQSPFFTIRGRIGYWGLEMWVAVLHWLLHCSFISFTAPAGSPRKVHVSNYTSPYSLLVTWQEIHPAAQNGVILGYRVLYTLVLVSRQTEITTDIEEITVQAPTKNVLLTGLSSFSLYMVEVLVSMTLEMDHSVAQCLQVGWDGPF